MRCAYFDCFSGAAGDMIVAALIDAGWSLDALREVVKGLNLRGVEVTAEKVQRAGLAATHVRVTVGEHGRQEPRHLADIVKIINDARLPASVAQRAGEVFTRLARAEAKVHGTPIESVHFHEVGAADAIVDIVGACTGVDALGLERVICSPIPTGSGTLTCAHGVLPIPAPATAELLRGVPLASCDEAAEMTTPTGAAILTTLAAAYGPLPALRIQKVGYGAGTRENRSRPNFLRLIIGDLTEEAGDEQDQVVVLEAQVDDAPGQILAHACERLLEAGALDVFIVPIIMKKGRPGQLLTVLGRPEDVATLENVIFSETTTFGIRRHECVRSKLAREHVTVTTRFGPIRIKVGRRGDQVRRAWPEYEDCAAAARRASAALREVQDEALQQWAKSDGGRHDRGD